MNATMTLAETDHAVEEAYRRMLASIKAEVNDKDLQLIEEAFEMALEAHRPQVRKTGEPYILHPIAVARICAEEIGLGATAITCALLHDVVEDTEVTLDDIEQRFGANVAKIVDGLTKLDSAYNAESPQAENFKKVLCTLVEDVRVVLIKMADRLHNMRTLGAMPREKQLKIAAETSYIYAPLAHRLGLYNFKTEYLDLCMKITDPETYHAIAAKLAETKRAREAYIESFVSPLRKRLDEQGLKCRVFGRAKSIYSIWNKVRGKEVDLEEIYDLFAVRIIADVPRAQEKITCWQIYSIVTDVNQPIAHRIKDWITTPKSNGYESLHTTVVGPGGRYVEVQIRSERMDEIAERGFAAHWKYKGGSNQPDVYEKWLDNVRAVLENPHSNAVEFLDDFRDSNLFNEEVYVYTPKGDMVMLPKGASALDFAFNIHTDVGYHCMAVKVNGKLVPMGHRLQNGDQVNVTTSKSQKPNESWLKMVVTGKAKAKIRSAAKEERRKKGEMAKEAFERKCKVLDIDIEETLDMLIKRLNYPSYVDLFYAIYDGTITMTGIFKQFVVENGKLVAAPEKDTEAKPGQPPKINRPRADEAPRDRLIIDGVPAEHYEYTLAPCCNPVQGDPVFAYIAANGGLRIHRANCPNATNMMANYGYRIRTANWGSAAGYNFIAQLLLEGTDDGPGVIGKISNTISAVLGLNIVELNIKGREGFFDANLRIHVDNVAQLNKAIEALRALSFVSTVTRLD